MVSATQSSPSPPSQLHPGNLEYIPDDVLQEILSHLPTLTPHQVLFGWLGDWPIIPSTLLVRTPVLRALSQTSRLLRSRCLPMAWRNLELCTVRLPKHEEMSYITMYGAIHDATENAVHVLNACPYLLPLIQTVSIIVTYIRFPMIVPALAACLAKLPNLTTIQVIHAELMAAGAVKMGFQGQRLPSVRRITLPDSVHPILQSLPNVEEVICIEGSGHEIIDSLVNGDCRRVRMLKGITAPLSSLVTLLPGLRYIEVLRGPKDWDLKPLADFPLLETIEIAIYCVDESNPQPIELIRDRIKEASNILKANASPSNEKVVIVTQWKGLLGRSESGIEDVTHEVIRV